MINWYFYGIFFIYIIFMVFINKLFKESFKRDNRWIETMRQDDVKSEGMALTFEIRIWMKRSLATQLQEKKNIKNINNKKKSETYAQEMKTNNRQIRKVNDTEWQCQHTWGGRGPLKWFCLVLRASWDTDKCKYECQID